MTPQKEPGRYVEFVCLADEDWEIPEFGWEPTFEGKPVGVAPLGSITMIAGRPGAGKSSLGRKIAADVTNGTLPGLLSGTPHNVMYIAGEENIKCNVIPGLIAAGTDMRRIKRPTAKFVAPDGEIEEVAIVPEKDMSTVIEECKSSSVRLIVVDPIMHFMNGIDVYKNNEVREKLRPWQRLAEETGAMVMAIVHLNKAGNGDVVAGINGSSAFGEIARCVVGCAHNKAEDNRILSVEKNSMGEEGAAWHYSIVGVDVRHPDGRTANVGMFVLGDDSDQTVGDMLRSQGEDESTLGAKDVVLDFLTGCGGSAPANDVRKEIQAAGFAWKTVQNKRSKWGVNSKKIGDVWHWELKVLKVPAEKQDPDRDLEKPSPTIEDPKIPRSHMYRDLDFEGGKIPQDPARSLYTQETGILGSSQVNTQKQDPEPGSSQVNAPANELTKEIEQMITNSLSTEHGLSESTVLGSVPTKVASREVVKSILDALLASGAVALDNRGRYVRQKGRAA